MISTVDSTIEHCDIELSTWVIERLYTSALHGYSRNRNNAVLVSLATPATLKLVYTNNPWRSSSSSCCSDIQAISLFDRLWQSCRGVQIFQWGTIFHTLSENKFQGVHIYQNIGSEENTSMEGTNMSWKGHLSIKMFMLSIIVTLRGEGLEHKNNIFIMASSCVCRLLDANLPPATLSKLLTQDQDEDQWVAKDSQDKTYCLEKYVVSSVYWASLVVL